VSRTTQVTIDGRQLKLSNLDKVLYPAHGRAKSSFTKADVLHYYAGIAPVILPHLAGRPLTLKRYPEGVEGFHFYEKQCPSHRPSWVKLKRVPRQRGGRDIDYCVIEDRPSLIWVANLASLELHTLLSCKDDVNRPTVMVFDLDPGAPAGILDSARVALWLRDLFVGLKLKCFLKTSGGKGLHLYVPLNTPVTFDQTKAFSRAVAESLEQRYPDRVISKMSKALRKGKVFVDWSQNDRHKTTVCVYSLRARERPTVSTPITWEEAETAARGRKTERLTFEAPEALSRVEERGDLFEPVLKLKQRLPEIEAAKVRR
jgi:bifunctional non-homologous end joining protein LigD